MKAETAKWQEYHLSQAKPHTREVYWAFHEVTQTGPLVSFWNACSNSVRHILETSTFPNDEFWGEDLSVVW